MIKITYGAELAMGCRQPAGRQEDELRIGSIVQRLAVHECTPAKPSDREHRLP